MPKIKKMNEKKIFKTKNKTSLEYMQNKNNTYSNNNFKKEKQVHNNTLDDPVQYSDILNNTTKNMKRKNLKRLGNNLKSNIEQISHNDNVNKRDSLRQRMQKQLKASRFRYLNEQLYTIEGKEAQQIFRTDPESFYAYHEGFRQQVAKWPINPLDKIIKAVKKMPSTYVIADFGCGEAKLAKSVVHKVHSFDLLETVPDVVACDMAHCKLRANSIDVAVYCLSLMGTNIHDYLIEANRVLKIGGILKIAEVESRFDNIETFIQSLRCFGFNLTWKDIANELFYYFDFKKERNVRKKNTLPKISLKPCLYKKR